MAWPTPPNRDSAEEDRLTVKHFLWSSDMYTPETSNQHIMQIKEPVWVSVEPRNRTVFETILAFLDSAHAEPANVDDHANTILSSLTSVGTPEPSVDEYKNESRVLFAILFTIVKQLDADAVQQDHLITLVLLLRQVPIPLTVSEAMDEFDLDTNMNHDLSKLINVLSAFERDAPLHPRPDDRADPYFYEPPERPPWRQQPNRYLSAEEWTNINAFVARLHTAAPDCIYLDLRGLMAMIEALEQPLTPSQLDDVLPAAACWIVYAGQALRSNHIPYANNDDGSGSKRLPWSRGELWNGPHAFNPARWDFWMQRFKGIAERGDVSNGVKKAALRALEAGAQCVS